MSKPISSAALIAASVITVLAIVIALGLRNSRQSSPVTATTQAEIDQLFTDVSTPGPTSCLAIHNDYTVENCRDEIENSVAGAALVQIADNEPSWRNHIIDRFRDMAEEQDYNEFQGLQVGRGQGIYCLSLILSQSEWDSLVSGLEALYADPTGSFPYNWIAEYYLEIRPTS
jgi:hypothetical protein